MQTTEYCIRCENIDENRAREKCENRNHQLQQFWLWIFFFVKVSPLSLFFLYHVHFQSLSNTAAIDNGGKLNVQLKFMLLPVLYWNTWFDSFMLSFYFVLLQSMTGAVWNSKKKKCANAQLKIFLRSRYFESRNFQIIHEMILCLGSKWSFFTLLLLIDCNNITTEPEPRGGCQRKYNKHQHSPSKYQKGQKPTIIFVVFWFAVFGKSECQKGRQDWLV